MTPGEWRDWRLTWIPRAFAMLGVLVAVLMLSAAPSVKLQSSDETAACRPVIDVTPVEVSRYYVVPEEASDAVSNHISPPEYRSIVGPDEVDWLDGHMAYAIGCEQARMNRLTTTLIVSAVWAFAAHRWFVWANRLRREYAEAYAAAERRAQENENRDAQES